ncbi:MAG: amidohydrolase, partial [Synergistaceae bacterium]
MKIENLEDQAKHLLGEFVHVMASCEESKQLSGGNAATCHIKEELERMSIEAALFSDFGCVIGIIQGGHPGTAVALQADTNTLYQSKDALPQETETHCSDAVMLLAAAAIINKMKAELHGSVILIFQDSRKPCINFLSCCDNNKFSKPNGIFAVRLSEYIDDGLVNFQKGIRTAFCSKFRIVVHGCASHGSTPQLSKDAVVAASAIIMAVQTYASRRNDPLNPFALTISQIKAGSQFNIIADTASMLGAAYSFSAKTHEELKATLTELANGAAASMGCTAEIEITETKKTVVSCFQIIFPRLRRIFPVHTDLSGTAEKETQNSRKYLCPIPPQHTAMRYLRARFCMYCSPTIFYQGGNSMSIKEEALELRDYVVSQRRYMHAHPELSAKEYETTKHITEELRDTGAETITCSDITGVIGIIKGTLPGKTVMLRADIDALPISEPPNKPYSSQNIGVMHACGHDCHAAMLLGAAKLLAAHRSELHGTVKLLFQMGEEIGRSSENYVKNGSLDGTDAIFGMHVWPLIESGKANFEDGERMASSDRFSISIYGKSSPAGMPETGHDSIAAAASVVMALQAIVSRLNSPANSLVISVGMMNGGETE